MPVTDAVPAASPTVPPPPSQAAVVPRPPPVPPRRLGVEDLLGRSADDLVRLFGQPALLKREPPAEVWQFAGGRCTLLAFLYPANGGLRVQHAETLARRQVDTVAPADCLESLLKGKPPALS